MEVGKSDETVQKPTTFEGLLYQLSPEADPAHPEKNLGEVVTAYTGMSWFPRFDVESAQGEENTKHLLTTLEKELPVEQLATMMLPVGDQDTVEVGILRKSGPIESVHYSLAKVLATYPVLSTLRNLSDAQKLTLLQGSTTHEIVHTQGWKMGENNDKYDARLKTLEEHLDAIRNLQQQIV
jgi:hypothetical protein